VSYALSYRQATANQTENLDFFQSVPFYRRWIELVTSADGAEGGIMS